MLEDPGAVPEEDRDWEAEGDARTLADAEEIMRDPGRSMAAKKAAKKLSEEKNKQAEAMSSVAGKQGPIEAGGAMMGAIPLSHYRR